MYYKKVWIIILIIVVVSCLFPSILIAKADEGEGDEFPPDDIPDLVYSFQDAPFPGNFYNLTEGAWQDFIDRAEELEHKVIYKISGFTTYYQAGNSTTKWYDVPFYFSSDGTGVEDYTVIDDKRETTPEKRYRWETGLRFIDIDNLNMIDKSGHNREPEYSQTDYEGIIWYENRVMDFKWNSYEPDEIPVGGSFAIDVYYRADVVDNPYQNMPDRYNIDPQRGYGMSFLKPAFGDWINIPHKLGTYRDTIEIEIQIPQTYTANDGITYQMFNVNEGLGQVAVPNFAIKLNSHNVKRIEGSQVVGRDGIWILPNNIRFIEGFMDGSYMHSARFIASVPIEHAKPPDGNDCLIVADLVIHKSGGLENYSVEIPEARTWTKYLIYYGTVDQDGDGFDDRTGLPINDGRKPGDSIKDDKPNRDDYEDGILGTISYYFDTLIWYIKQPFVFIADLIGNIIDWISTTIDSWIDGFTSIFTKLFSFLPAEVILMLALGFATMMIITIIRAIRGS